MAWFQDPNNRPQSAVDMAAALRRCKDAGQWSPEQARAWWAEYGARDRVDDHSAVTHPDSLLEPTVEVDLAERT